MVESSTQRPGRWRLIGAGLLSGLVAGFLLVVLQGIVRLAFGVGTPAVLLGDRVAPELSISQFFYLFSIFGGYDHLKQFGVLSGTLGELALTGIIGAGYGWLRYRALARGGHPQRWLAAAVGLVTLAAIGVLWPNLDTNFFGLPPAAARAATIGVIVLTFGVFALTTVLLYGWMTRPARGDATPDEESPDEGSPAAPVGRRAVLAGGVGVGLAVATGGIGAVLFDRATFSYDGTQNNALGFGPGSTLRGITANEDFYQVTKNVVDPRVNEGWWRFTLGGEVARPRTFGYDELVAMPAVEQETTLMCISNRVGQGLISNARWTGVRLADLIAEAGPGDGVVEVVLTSVDGYRDTFSIDKAMEDTTLLAYGMNGVPLPQQHGYPARMIVPGMFGEKNVKWVTRVDLVTEEAEGFYEKQGWGPNFTVPTRSRFAYPDLRQPMPLGRTVELSGDAFAGDRGVSRVEVSTDGGTSWAPAEIVYSGGRLTWALWRFPWTPQQTGEQKLVVRAVDGSGTLQTDQSRSFVPQGATGYHQVTARVVDVAG